MPDIRILDAHVADLIAAGEVVERPANVVKELMENSIDAGAKKLTVEIENGGMTLIRVSDDGCGIPADQLATAFLRHATSKLRTEYDLEAIGTLGFRGEALAAICAVSRVEVCTRTPGAQFGAGLRLEGGVPGEVEQIGCPEGTVMTVRDLFFNTPARQKFLKKDAAEGAAVFAAVQHVALAHPEVSVRFLRDGKQELLTPGDGQLRSALYSVLGRDQALGFLSVQGSGEGMSVSGFASLPACCKGSRNYQHFFVNGRWIKSPLMTAAVEEAYANQKMVGRFPGCVLHLTVRAGAVDVNVHPTKQQVKFADERQVFSCVYNAVLSALTGDRTHPAAVADKPKPHDTLTPNQTALPGMGASAPRTPPVTLHDVTHPAPAQPAPPAPPRAAPVPPAPPRPTPPPAPAGRPSTPPAPPQAVPTPPPAQPAQDTVAPWRVAGELFHTYIVVEQGDRALLIDKHAAHERMNFDRLKAQGYRPMMQTLLTPLTFTPDARERAALLAQLPLLTEFGFEVESFGTAALVVRQAPSDLDTGAIVPALTEIASRLLAVGSADPDTARDEVLHTIACKAAIKGGWTSGAQELERIAQAVMDGSVKCCPHGRPVAIELTRKSLEKQFGRA